MGKLLEGVRVLDLSQAYSAPFGTMHLADHGAEVIKVEALGGDQSRTWDPMENEYSGYYAYINRNKEGITLNLKKEEGKELESRLNITTKVDNDANVAALGEMWKGGGEGHEDVVLFTLGTGVGGGIVVKGKILNGSRGVAGELGHFVVNPDEPEACNCGNHGCLEQYASATGVVRVAKRLIRSSALPSALRGCEEITAKDIFDRAKEGDALALRAVDTMGRYLGQVMAAVCLTVDPDVIVLGGGVSRAGKIIVDVVEKYFVMFTGIAKVKPEITLATLGNDAGIYGSARLALL